MAAHLKTRGRASQEEGGVCEMFSSQFKWPGGSFFNFKSVSCFTTLSAFYWISSFGAVLYYATGVARAELPRFLVACTPFHF